MLNKCKETWENQIYVQSNKLSGLLLFRKENLKLSAWILLPPVYWKIIETATLHPLGIQTLFLSSAIATAHTPVLEYLEFCAAIHITFIASNTQETQSEQKHSLCKKKKKDKFTRTGKLLCFPEQVNEKDP